MATEQQPLYVFTNEKEVGLDKVPPGSLVGFLCTGAIFRLADKTGIDNTTIPSTVKGTKLKEYSIVPDRKIEEVYTNSIISVATFVAETSGSSWDAAIVQTNKWKEPGFSSITLPNIVPDFISYDPDFAYPGEPADPYQTEGSSWWNASASLETFWKPTLIALSNTVNLPVDYPDRNLYQRITPLINITNHDIWVTVRFAKY